MNWLKFAVWNGIESFRAKNIPPVHTRLDGGPLDGEIFISDELLVNLFSGASSPEELPQIV